ncbi:MAG TPA: hypothetical protein VKQ52_18810 [Puia sp.]|nr:hypothetical protein [Puia sp.]
MGADEHMIEGAKALYEKLELFGNGSRAHELSAVVKQHALLGVGVAAIPVPGLDIVALGVNTWTMYVRISEIVGVSFGEHALKAIASGVIANLASVIPGLALGLGAEGLLKMIPGVGTLGGMAVGAVVNVGIMYASGKVYVKALEKLVNKGLPLTEENIAKEAHDASKEKSFVTEAYKEGKTLAKNQKK